MKFLICIKYVNVVTLHNIKKIEISSYIEIHMLVIRLESYKDNLQYYIILNILIF